MAWRRARSVAVLADIHGGLPALQAVLGEPDVTAADAVVLPGDIALTAGRYPSAAEWAREYVLHHYCDVQAPAACTEIARQQEIQAP